jgi:hypothetical protein
MKEKKIKEKIIIQKNLYQKNDLGDDIKDRDDCDYYYDTCTSLLNNTR